MKYNLRKDLKYVQTILGISNPKFASFLGIGRMSLDRYQKDQVNPTYDNLEKIYSSIYEKGINLNRVKEEFYESTQKKNHKILFHGSKEGIDGDISIEYSDVAKDFGKGFYLGESFNQSAKFVCSYDTPEIYIFDADLSNLKIKEYDVSKEWMLLIAYFRHKIPVNTNSKIIKELLEDLKGIDVVIAPIADNTMYSIMENFLDGLITDMQCTYALSANRLGKQYVFLNDKAIKDNLKLLDCCFISKLEKKDYLNERFEENEIGKQKVKLAIREYAGAGKYIEDILNE